MRRSGNFLRRDFQHMDTAQPLAFQEDLKKKTAELLRQIDPKYQPYGKDFFEPLARLIVNIGIEAVFIRYNPGAEKYEILLRKRDESETYPGQWHIPGSLLRYSEDFDAVFDRILKEECAEMEVSSYRFIGLNNNTDEARGHVVQIVYRCDVEYNGKSEVGLCSWFSSDDLPEPIVDHHLEIVIPMVIRSIGSR